MSARSTRPPISIEKLRAALRRLSRGQLLIIADRAAELVPAAQIPMLVRDMVGLGDLVASEKDSKSLLDEVREFHVDSLSRKYYDSFGVNSQNFMTKSEGTEEFIADFDRLLGRCVQASSKGPRTSVREAFGLLFDLLRRLDESPDDIVFFADEGGSWQVDVDWDTALPAYFRCLADDLSPGDYAREVDRTIADFADYDRPRNLAAARRVGNAEQKAALRRLPARKRRR